MRRTVGQTGPMLARRRKHGDKHGYGHCRSSEKNHHVALAGEETRITEDSKFKGDLGADSLDVFEVTMSLEEEFDIDIPDNAVANLVTVGDAIAFIRARAV